ncbi:N-acetylmuramidase domain-containing protein [Bartonella schoenbuchensis]|uniref:Peptidoglycan binding domain-containing protein n=1 Tax=Bartonella schoenbuchensis m07a TaxID=1094496 RepID=N6UE43_9HYPH|nr:N-acetylmuramidase domain-containing protein [Bartonella schoenbuchensis]ENN90834.1 peptidoglycan binding domain-containing protein [Bartonella schoenbuchensis m07a]
MTDIIEKLLNGNCKARTQGLIKSLAQEIGCEEAVVAAIISVESDGKGFDDEQRVKVLFEKHQFYKNLPPHKRKQAVKEDLARKEWISIQDGGYKEQKTNTQALELLIAAMTIDEEAALKSASYGAGQILGSNYGMLGWKSVQDFVTSMCSCEDEQIKAMFTFFKKRGLASSLRDKDFNAIARAYNGSGMVEEYGRRMRSAYCALTKKTAAVSNPIRATGLRLGCKGYRVEALQKRLNDLGYPVAIDSDYGPNTRSAIFAFQADHNLEVDGVVGAKTQAALDVATPMISPRRSGVSMAYLRKKGTNIIKDADKTEMVGKAVVAGSTLMGAEQMGVFDNLKLWTGKMSALVEPLAHIGKAISDHWWIGAIFIGLIVVVVSGRVKKAYLNAYKKGRAI